MTPKPSEKEATAPTVETTTHAATTPAVEAAAPTVETNPALAAGDTVKHANGSKYTIRQITPEGIALVGVANLVHPSALTKI